MSICSDSIHAVLTRSLTLSSHIRSSWQQCWLTVSMSISQGEISYTYVSASDMKRTLLTPGQSNERCFNCIQYWYSFDLQHFYQISRQKSWQNSTKIYCRIGRRRRRKKNTVRKRIPTASLPFSLNFFSFLSLFFVSSSMRSVWFKNNNCYFFLSSKVDGRHWFAFSLNNISIAVHRTCMRTWS